MKKNKKQRKLRGKSTFIASILSIFGKNPYRPFNYKQVSSQLGIIDKASKNLVSTILGELAEANEIEEIRPGKYKLNNAHLNKYANKGKKVSGKVDMMNTGKAYIISDEGGDDIFIASNNAFHALHGDRVSVLLFPQRKGRKPEGQIVEILERAREQFVGTINISQYYAFVIPDNPKIHIDLFIPLDKLNGANHGDKVIAKLLDWPDQAKNPFGSIEKVLGKPGNNNVEMESILVANDFALNFPDGVEKEASKIDGNITKEEIKKRRDFRKITTFTIDPIDAKDFDDALSLQKLSNGNWEVGIHIADVSHFVKPNTLLDKEAFDRATSIYLVDRVVPMLPEVLSNGVCSLRPQEEKYCFSAVFEMNEEAKVLNQWFGKTIINSDRRFTYEEVQEIIENEKGEFDEELLKLNKLAKILRGKRYENGSINFHSQDVRFQLDENGKPLSVYVKEQKDSNRLIEDFMLLANRKVAEFIGKTKGKKKPKTFIYRVHDEPNPEKLNTFLQFVNKLGYKMLINTRQHLSKSFNKLFKDISGKGEENMIESIAIRTMAKAEYSTQNIGHYGLAFNYYSHFTSPIRRYPDLLTHRILEWYLEGRSSVSEAAYEEMCNHCSEMERKAEAAERESVKYKQVEYMLDKIGKQFEGLISGVSKWGLFVEIIENKCEGMVRLKDMKDDFYYLDEDNYQVIGQRYGDQYKLGDQIRIMVKKIDVSKKQMDFKIVNSK